MRPYPCSMYTMNDERRLMAMYFDFLCSSASACSMSRLRHFRGHGCAINRTRRRVAATPCSRMEERTIASRGVEVEHVRPRGHAPGLPCCDELHPGGPSRVSSARLSGSSRGEVVKGGEPRPPSPCGTFRTAPVRTCLVLVVTGLLP